MKRFLFTVVVAFFAFTVASEVANAQFLIGPKAEKKWMEYFYRANGASPAPKPSMLIGDSSVGFDFLTTADTTQFMTGHPAYNGILLGDKAGKTVSATYEISALSGDPSFFFYGQPAGAPPCGRQASVRFYFSTQNNDLGYSQYWWSRPESAVLAVTTGQHLNASLVPEQWSDWDGHMGSQDQAHQDAFAAAAADIQYIGLSFGGGCFFANGVGVDNGTASFTLTNFSVNN